MINARIKEGDFRINLAVNAVICRNYFLCVTINIRIAYFLDSQLHHTKYIWLIQ